MIISQWTSMLHLLAFHLDLAGVSYAVIEGSVPARKRMLLVERFNKDKLKPKVGQHVLLPTTRVTSVTNRLRGIHRLC